MTAALEVERVSHAFGRTRALDEVSLRVEEGSFTALLGVNGAGKTTLFSLITRLYDNVSGRIAVFGHDLRQTPGPALAELGVVFQSRALDADLSVAQNLAYHAALHGLPARLGRARAAEVLAQVGLAERARSRVRELSGGQQRRAEIARCLMHRPRLLLVDFPPAADDVAEHRLDLDRAADTTERGGCDELRPGSTEGLVADVTRLGVLEHGDAPHA